MKKILSIIIIGILLTANIQIAYGQFQPSDTLNPSFTNEFTGTPSGSTDSQNEDAEPTETPDPETTTEPEEPEAPIGEFGKPGDRRQTVLPPIIKPDILPGPNLTEGTGNEVRGFIISKFLPAVAKRLVAIVAVISLIGLVISGILFFTSFGETDKVGKARKAAIYSVLGLVIAILSFTIVQIINLLPIGNVQ